MCQQCACHSHTEVGPSLVSEGYRGKSTSPKVPKKTKEHIQVTCSWMGRPAAAEWAVSKPAGFSKIAVESFLALLLILSLLFRWDGIITQGICAHVIDLAHLKQHTGLHVICCTARIRTTARSGRTNDHGKHPHGQCGAQLSYCQESGAAWDNKAKRNKIEVGYGR